MTSLTIGITTRNRPDALARCLASLDILAPMRLDVLVFDDGSDPPAECADVSAGLDRDRTIL